MKISKLVAKMIQGNSVQVQVFGNTRMNQIIGDTTTQYGYLISREESSYTVLLSTGAYAETREKAQFDGEGLLNRIRQIDLSRVLEDHIEV